VHIPVINPIRIPIREVRIIESFSQQQNCVLKPLGAPKSTDRATGRGSHIYPTKKTAVGFVRANTTDQWSCLAEKSNGRFAVFSVTSIAPAAGTEHSATPTTFPDSVLHAANKKRRLKPSNHDHMPWRKSSIVVLAGISVTSETSSARTYLN
jgi:hypothetical protein